MLNVTNGQSLIFLIFFALGFAIAIIYLLTTHFIKKIKITALLIIFDLIYSIICFLVFFLLLLQFNYGELRLYIIIAVLLGILIPYKIFSIIVAKKLEKRYTTIEIKKE